MSDRLTAARLVSSGAATVAASVLADSAMEHYRGSYANRAMVLPLGSSALSLVSNVAIASVAPRGRAGMGLSHLASILVGLTGLGFHAYNVTRKPGGLRLNNLFYQAPIGAPAALALSGVLGAMGTRLARGSLPVPGRAIGAVVALGIAGTVAEAGLLHFRGAFHDPFMWLPLTVPPLAALALARDTIAASATTLTTALLGATAALGLVGSAFHAWGVSRNMGGWANWRQNLLAGPPLPAPPAFTGLAIAGLGALILLRRRRA